MARPNPAAGILCGWRSFVSIEAREIHAPFVTFLRRQGAAVGRERFHPAPGKSQFDTPTAIDVAVAVDRAVEVHSGLFSREAPVEIAKASAAGMLFEIDAVEWFQFGTGELRGLGQITLLIRVVPDEEHF